MYGAALIHLFGYLAFPIIIGVAIYRTLANRKSGQPMSSTPPEGDPMVLCDTCKNWTSTDLFNCEHCSAPLLSQGERIVRNAPVEERVDTTWLVPEADTSHESLKKSMSRLGIVFDGAQYVYGPYRYDKLTHAVAYAEEHPGLASQTPDAEPSTQMNT
jgi:hypothetical protein